MGSCNNVHEVHRLMIVRRLVGDVVVRGSVGRRQCLETFVDVFAETSLI